MIKLIAAAALLAIVTATPAAAGLLDTYNDIARENAVKTLQDAKACSNSTLIQFAVATQESAQVVVAAAIQKCAESWNAPRGRPLMTVASLLQALT
jgi:hypothetical protein